VWESGGGRQFYNVVVRPSPGVARDRLEGLRRELRTELPGQQVRVSSEDGLVYLRGTVKDLTSSARAMQIASTAGKVVNLLYVDVPSSQPQILLKVRFAAVDRSLEKQLGLNLFSLGATNSIGSVTTGQFGAPTFTPPTTGGNSATAGLSNLGNLFIFRPDLNLGATLEALQTRGLLEVLAEPNVLTINGKQASFLAGGEYPYPVVNGVTGGGTGAVTIQFKEFGVRLNFIPTITPRNTIRLQVAPEVSALDFTNGVTIGGFTVPGLTVRRVKTDVELKEGQSFAIGGLLDNRETETFNKIPFIGDVPVLGKLFQSISRTKTNTELIVIVTPEIVAPIPVGAPLPQVNYPVPFLPSNSNHAMINPGPDVTGAKPLPDASPTMPVEKLIESMQPEQPLVIEGSMSTSGYGTQGGGGSTGITGTSAPQ
jgi:pilus assembly protein CpaC